MKCGFEVSEPHHAEAEDDDPEDADHEAGACEAAVFVVAGRVHAGQGDGAQDDAQEAGDAQQESRRSRRRPGQSRGLALPCGRNRRPQGAAAGGRKAAKGTGPVRGRRSGRLRLRGRPVSAEGARGRSRCFASWPYRRTKADDRGCDLSGGDHLLEDIQRHGTDGSRWPSIERRDSTRGVSGMWFVLQTIQA